VAAVNTEKQTDTRVSKVVLPARDRVKHKFVNQPQLVAEFPTSSYEPIKYQYKVALISMNIPLNYFEYVSVNNSKRSRIRKDVARQVARSIIRLASEACKANARIICFIRHRLAKLAKNKGCYIIAGSHVMLDPSAEGYAAAYIFTPYHDEPFHQYKNQRGFLGGKREPIKVPDTKVLRIFHTEYGLFAVSICIDAQDLNLLHNLVNLHHTEDFRQSVDLLLVPGYCEKKSEEDLRSDCETASRFGKLYVAWVNESSSGPPAVYLCGDDVPYSTNGSGPIANGDGIMHLFTVDLAAIRNRRREEYADGARTSPLSSQ
jgi:hypothetical protein